MMGGILFGFGGTSHIRIDDYASFEKLTIPHIARDCTVVRQIFCLEKIKTVGILFGRNPGLEELHI